jgi:hypothetical protein
MLPFDNRATPVTWTNCFSGVPSSSTVSDGAVPIVHVGTFDGACATSVRPSSASSMVRYRTVAVNIADDMEGPQAKSIAPRFMPRLRTVTVISSMLLGVAVTCIGMRPTSWAGS